MLLKIYQIDAFSREKFKGNAAGVVINADGLDDSQMQQIARELNNSETAFLFPPDSTDCDGMIRYFTPTTEVPICGHATIAALYALAIEKGMSSCILNMKTNVGILPLEIIHSDGTYQIVMTQGKFELSPPLSDNISQDIVEALGLDDSDREEKCPLQVASTGHSKVMIGIKSREKLNALTPDFNKLSALSKLIHCNGYFVFTFDSDNPDILIYGRMFAPAIGINEDPVTGNANGPLGGYLVSNGLVPYGNDVLQFSALQGEKMGRPGMITVDVKINEGKPIEIRIKGDAVTVFKTEIEM